MPSPNSLTRCLLLAGLLSAVPACSAKERTLVLYPPAADIAAVTESKPVAPVDIVTSEAAADAYDIEVETWGERLQAAGARICRWANDNGAKYACPTRPTK